MRLSTATAARLPAGIARPQYDRDVQKCGIVHFGIGAFHRAHQAVYTDDAMNTGDRDWGIIGVSLRSNSVADQMNPQDGLYTVVARAGDDSQSRLIGAVRHVLVARDDPEAVIAALAAPTTHIVTFTITEKGYCRAPGGDLDFVAADDASVYRYLKDGLARRRSAGLPGLTLLSCDNLAHNGAQLERLFAAYLTGRDPTLGDWIAAHCTFPSSMVDRIVPATTEADRAAFEACNGVTDAGLVLTEPFTQWVIEDRFAGPRPRWEAVGAELVANVAPYEMAKLRMLNGAHSALAYLGLDAGHDFVHQAVHDPAIRPLIECLMRDEAIPSIAAAPGQDLGAYADALLARFENSALNHRLNQIAMDGSQKIPQRWLETLGHHGAQGRQCPALLTALASWLGHVRGDRRPVDDPLAAQLATTWQAHGRENIVTAIFGAAGLLASDWQATERDRAFILSRLPL